MDLLDLFEQYLIDRGYSQVTPSGHKSTTYDYAKIRIPFVANEEDITVRQLYNEIDDYIRMYDVNGAKEDLGKKSHKSVINALKRFKEFKENEC